MKTEIFYRGPYQIPFAARALCADGKVRKFRTAQAADTFFSLPARGSIRGISILGYITSRDGGYVFVAYQYHPNYPKLKELNSGF